jgi:sigma-E factor negative regulatory protein RseC
MMADKIDCIIKSGIVEEVEENYLKVKIHSHSACSMCYSKGVCTSLGSGERVVDVENDNMHDVKPGDIVDIQMVSSSGWVAVMLGYIFPFILLLGTLLFISKYTSEGFAALISLSILLPYYLLLYLFRRKMRKYFRFTLS